MKNFKLFLFFIFLAIYAVGVGTGSMRQIKSANQDEMYAYLESGIGEYDVSAVQSIKSVAVDNAKILAVILAGGLFRLGVIAVAGAIFIKGYAAGFAITAVLRFLGIKGMLLCGANLLSAMLLVPTIAYYGSAAMNNLLENRQDKRRFFKNFCVLAIFVFAIFCVDSLSRGFFSSIFMNLAGGMVKSA